jgi:hypothetical protein
MRSLRKRLSREGAPSRPASRAAIGLPATVAFARHVRRLMVEVDGGPDGFPIALAAYIGIQKILSCQ